MLLRSVLNKGFLRNGKRHGFGSQYPLSSLLESFECARRDEHISSGNASHTVPPFGCTFSTAGDVQNILAVTNEDGIVRLYNTDSQETPILKEWMAHDNAVFDVAWVPGESSLVTASGDQTAKLWNAQAGELLGTFKGHQCSLKSVAFPKQEKAVFCTGGRDGNIMVWDTRCSKKDGFYRQVKQITGAHNKVDRYTPPRTKRKKQACRGMAPPVDSQQSVTVVLFSDENTLISSGAVDGTIKMWDLRKNYTAYHHDPVPLQTYPYPGSSTRKLGYSGLTLDSTGSNLFSNCTDDNIYMFNITGLRTAPVAVFSGHQNSSFYVKSTVSPDNQFLVSGSSDSNAYIWKISEPKSSPVMLQGHNQEVTSVAWCPTDFTKIASCSDDNTVRIWRLNRGADRMRSSFGEPSLVGWACTKPALDPKTSGEAKSCGPACSSEHTPTKSPREEGSAVLLSPQAALCAPSSADLPLPSSTPASAYLSHRDSEGLSAGSPREATTSAPVSIRDWIARSPGSSRGSSPRALTEVQSPSLQSSGQTSSTCERRVKRRLESGGEGKRGSGLDCHCIIELYPSAKKGRGLGPWCCSNPEKEGEVASEEATPLQEEGIPTSLKQENKENSTPGGAHWLSALQEKLRSSPQSPPNSRSLGAPKRAENRATGSAMTRTPRSMKKISSYFPKRNPEGTDL